MRAEVNIHTQNQRQQKQLKGPCWDHYWLISSLRARESGIEFTLSRFADDTKLYCAAGVLEGKYATQRSPVRLEEGACVNLMILNMAKDRVLHLNQGNPLKVPSSPNHYMVL